MENPRRQQRKSCDLCRRRKVRCNLAQKKTTPCDVCEKGGFKCTTRESWPTPKRASLSSRPASSTFLSLSQVRIEPAPQSNSSGPDTNSSAVQSRQIEDPTLHETAVSPSINSDHFVRTNLSCFFDDENSADWWRVFQVPDDFRVAYIGTNASNLVHLVDLRRSHGSLQSNVPLDIAENQLSVVARHSSIGASSNHLNTRSQIGHDIGREGSAGPRTNLRKPQRLLHYPYPRIRPPPTWQPQSEVCIQSSQELATDLSSFPAQEVREALVAAYFEHIHPSFPVVTESWILEPNRKPRRLGPLLLFQAVLLAGAHVCSHPLVAKDRQMVKSVLYRRASMLYHLRHETDRLLLMQAALLFTWHIKDGDTVSGGPWYWTGEAVRIGSGLGMHRHNNQLPIHDRVFYKRTWWCAFTAEVFASLELGRPCAIRKDDIDQSMLRREELDRIEQELMSSDSKWKNIFQTISLDYHRQMVELAFIALDVLQLNSPATSQKLEVPAIDAKLASWTIKSGASGHNLKDEDFFTKQLRIHYNLVVLHLHRNHTQESSTSQQNCSTAAQSIIGSLEEISLLGRLDRCPFTVVGAVTAAGIQLVHEIRLSFAQNASLVALSHLDRLGRLMKCTKTLSHSSPGAEAVFNVFDSLRREYLQNVAQGLHEPESTPPEYQLDWDSLFASMPATQVEDIGIEHEWLSLANWTNLE